jgi:Phage protein
LHNWNSGRYDIPFAAFKLLRVLLRYEIPHDDWQGWHFSGGKLWTPEGYSIAAHESAWWSLLIRRAQMFSSLYARCNQLEAQLRDGGTVPGPAVATQAKRGARTGAAQVTPTGAAGRAAQQPGPNSFIGHISTEGRRNIFEAVRLPLDPIRVFPHHEKEKNHG